MGLIVSLADASANCGGTYTRSLSIFDFLYGSSVEWIALSLASVVRVLMWLAGRVLAIVLAVFNIVTSLVMGYRMLFYAFGLLLGAWLFWLSFPSLVDIVVNVAWPFVNFYLILWQFNINLLVQLYDITLQVWNNSVPLMGMVLQVLLSFLLTYCNTLIKALGSPALSEAYELLMSLRNFFIQIGVDLVQALAPTAAPLLMAFAEAFGPVVNITMLVAPFIFKYYSFLWITLPMQLMPVFKLLLWVVKKAADFFGKSSLSSFAVRALLATAPLHALPSHPRIAGSAQYDDLNYDFWTSVAAATRRYSTEQSLARTASEMQVYADFTHSLHLQSFQYYFEATHSIWRPSPGYAGASSTSRALFSMTDVHNVSSSSNGTLDALAFGATLYERSSTAQKHSVPLSASYHEGTERYTDSAKLLASEPQRNLTDDLHARAEHVRHVVRSAGAHLDALPGHRAAHAYLRERALEPVGLTSFLHERDAEIVCRSKHCGGHGKRLKHPLRSIGDEYETVTRWLPDAATHVHSVAEQKRRYVHAAVHTHALRKAWKHVHTDASLQRQHKSLARFAGEALHRVTGHRTVNDLVDATLGSYGSLADVIHAHNLVPSEWPGLRWLAERDPTRHDRPYWGDHVRATQVHELEETDTHGRTYRTYYMSDGTSSSRKLHTLAPLLDMLANTDCFTTRPRNPLCLPDFVPDNFRLNFAFPLAVPAWLKNPEELCDVYFIHIERVLPYATVPDYLEFVFWSPYVISWQRYVNGLQAIRLSLSLVLPGVTFAIERFGVTFPWLSFVSDALLALPGGAKPSISLVLCILVHTYDVLLLLGTVMLVSQVCAPVVRWLWENYTSYQGLVAMLRSWEQSRQERASNMAESQLWNTSYDSELNAGLMLYGDSRRTQRNALGVVQKGYALAPYRQTSPLDALERNEPLARATMGTGTGRRWTVSPNERNAHERAADTALHHQPNGPGTEFENRFFAGYSRPTESVAPASEQLLGLDMDATPAPTYHSPADVEHHEQALMNELLSPDHLEHLGALLGEGLNTWGQPWHSSDRRQLAAFEQRWSLLLRPHEYTYDYARQTLNALRARNEREQHASPMPGRQRAEFVHR